MTAEHKESVSAPRHTGHQDRSLTFLPTEEIWEEKCGKMLGWRLQKGNCCDRLSSDEKKDAICQGPGEGKEGDHLLSEGQAREGPEVCQDGEKKKL